MPCQLALDFAPVVEQTPQASPRPRAGPFEPILVRHPRARRYVVRVRADGSVRVTIPRGGSKRGAIAFAAKQREWIIRQRERVAEERRQQERVELAPDLHASLRAQARLVLPARLAELAARFKLTVARVSVRNQRWRWGSCSRDGHICLNWRLVQMPEWIRDYVMIHELMHLKHLDHSARFWGLVAAACPEYEQARRWLRQVARMDLG
jgi:hypothetical protein